MNEVHLHVRKPTREDRLQDFAAVDRAALARMDDKALAIWQSTYPADTPQFILAEHEWQRRLTAQQVGAMRFAAWLSIVGVVIGALLGAALTYWVSGLGKGIPEQPTRTGPTNTPQQQASQVALPSPKNEEPRLPQARPPAQGASGGK